jgi:hypothetical protein
MNKLQLEISEKGKKININLNTDNDSTIELAVLQSFAFMGVSDPFAVASPSVSSALEAKLVEEVKEETKEDKLTIAATEEVVAKEIAMEILDNAKPEIKSSRPRTLPLLNGSDSENTVAYSTKDDEEIKPPSLYNGTKMYNGITKYQTRYECPSCGNRGKRYLALDEHVAVCHECNQGMKKEAVGENGKLEQDHFGNFFIAKHGIL